MNTVPLFTYAGKQYVKDDYEKLMRNERNRAGYDSRLSAILKMVEGEKVLDVGCHVGILSRVIAEQGKKVTAIDILESAIDTARIFNQVDGVQYISGDIFDMGFKNNEFDCVIFLETIEHVYDPTLFLKEFYRILRPGGTLIISTPNAVSYLNILYHALFFSKRRQQQFVSSLGEELRNTGTQLDHIFLWDFRTLIRYLIRNGFKYSAHRFTGIPPFKVRIGKLSFSLFGRKEMRFLLPFLGPYLTTLVVKVVKP